MIDNGMNYSDWHFLNKVNLDEAMREADLVKWRDKYFVITEFNVHYGRRASLNLELDEVVFVKGEKPEEKMSQDQEEKKSTLEELADFVRTQTGAEPCFAESIHFFCHKIDELEEKLRAVEGIEGDLKKLLDILEGQK